MNLRLDYNNMMSEAVGSEGLDESVFAENAAFIEKAYKTVMDGRGKGWQEWCDLPYVGNDYLDEMISYCDGIRRKAREFRGVRNRRQRAGSHRRFAGSYAPASQRTPA